MDDAFQLGQVLLHGGLQDGVRGVEVAVSEVASQAGDLPPWDGRLSGKQVVGQCLDGLADLQQPDPDSVEYQAVGQVTALQVRADRINRSLDIGQPLAFPVAHSATRSRSTRGRTRGFKSAAGLRSPRLQGRAY